MVVNNLKEIRKARGLNQYELADKIGVVQSAINHWESGVVDLALARFDTILKICVALNCKAVDLFQDDYAKKCKRLSRKTH